MNRIVLKSSTVLPETKQDGTPLAGGRRLRGESLLAPDLLLIAMQKSHGEELSRWEAGKLHSNLSPASPSHGYQGFSFFLTVQDKVDAGGSW